MTVLRCVVKDVWHIAQQLEDGKKITPVEPVVVAFQGEDVRNAPPYLQILPCPQCGVATDRNHDPLKHVYVGLGTTPNEVIVPRKDVENERMESVAPAGGQEWTGHRRDGDEGRGEVLHEGRLVSLRTSGDGYQPERNGMVHRVFVPRWRGVIFLLDKLLNALEYLAKRTTRIRFRLLSK